MNVSDSSRNRKFSVGTKPARKMLMPSLWVEGDRRRALRRHKSGKLELNAYAGDGRGL